MLVIATFLVKALLVVAVSSAFRSRMADVVGRMMAAWLIVDGATIAFFLALSPRHAMTESWVLLGLAVAGLVSAFLLRRREAWPALSTSALWSAPFVALIAVMVVRSRLFQDFTQDAQTYGLVRLDYWMHARSLLVHAQTPQVNVFTNEWDGELVGLLYGVVSGDLQGPILGGVEILAVTYLSALWLARQVTDRPSWQQATATLVAVMPICLGLAATVKGDLLAVAGLMAAAGWALEGYRTRSPWSLPLCLAALALAVGSKISVAFSAVLLGAAAIAALWSTVTLIPALTSAVLCALFLVRFGLNRLQYGHFFVRVASEKPDPSIANLKGNVDLAWDSIVSFTHHDVGAPLYASTLTGGMGVTGFLALAGVVVLVVRRQRLLAMVALVLMGVAAAAFILPVYPWNFRYLLPGIAVAAVIGIGALRIPSRAEAAFAILVLGGVNAWYLAWPGDLNGNGTLGRALAELPTIADPIQRTFLAERTIRPIDIHGVLDLGRDAPRRIVAFQDINAEILPFQGGHAQNDVTLTADGPAFLVAVAAQRPDFAVYASPGEHPDIADALERAGYRLADVAPGYIVGVPASPPVQAQR